MSTAENKALVRQYFEVFHNQRQLDLGEQIFASDLLTPTLRMAAMMRTAFPDYQITIDYQLAEADLVATVWTASGSHPGEWASPMGRWRRRARPRPGPERPPYASSMARSPRSSAPIGTIWGSSSNSVQSRLPIPGRGPESAEVIGVIAPQPRG